MSETLVPSEPLSPPPPPTRKRRGWPYRHKLLSALGIIVLAGTIASVAIAVSGGDNDDEATTEPAATGPPPAAIISVTISDIDAAAGNQLAGVLYQGPEAVDPDHNAVGGFAVTIDSDPFSTTQQVRQPQTGAERRPFPGVSGEPLRVEPGTYTLVVWLAPELGPYSRWVPAATPGLAMGETTFDVAQDAMTVEIDGDSIIPVPGQGEANAR